MEGHERKELFCIALVGPTASGKTEIAVRLAEKWNAEVISADSRQVYRFMDIGTAKPRREELRGIIHYGFDIIDPDQDYSAGAFAADARNWIETILAKRKNVIIAGGSGLYLQALIDGFSLPQLKDTEIRKRLEERERREGLDSLYRELNRVDPDYFAKTMPKDRQRILRALEVFLISGIPFSRLMQNERDALPYRVHWVAVEHSRKVLYNRIDRRVEMMFDRGLVEEVRSLLDRGYRQANALKSVGYREIISWVDGETTSLVDAKRQIKQNTRHYAKRQLTWFRHNPRISWLPPESVQLETILP